MRSDGFTAGHAAEGSPLGPVVYLLPICESRGPGFRALVADLLGDGLKRRYEATPDMLTNLAAFGLGWRLGKQPVDPLDVRPRRFHG